MTASKRKHRLAADGGSVLPSGPSSIPVGTEFVPGVSDGLREALKDAGTLRRERDEAIEGETWASEQLADERRRHTETAHERDGWKYRAEASEAEVAEYRAKNFAPMSRIHRAERVAEHAVADKQATEATVAKLRAENERLARELADSEEEVARQYHETQVAEATIARIQARARGGSS